MIRIVSSKGSFASALSGDGEGVDVGIAVGVSRTVGEAVDTAGLDVRVTRGVGVRGGNVAVD